MPLLVVDLSNVPLSDLAAAIASVDFGNHRAINVDDPVSDQDAATKLWHNNHKYTNAEAIAAVLADDKYLKNTGDEGNNSYKFGIPSGIANKFEMEIDYQDAYQQGFKVTRKNASDSYFGIKTSTSSAGQFIPTMAGRSNEQYGGLGFMIIGEVVTAKDIWNTYYAAMMFQANRIVSSSVSSQLVNANILMVKNYSTVLMKLDVAGRLALGSQTPTALLDVNSDIIRIRANKTPATAGATGNTGDICWDTSYIYVCIATNSWKRVAIATW